MARFTVRSDLCTGCMNCQTVCSLLHSGKQHRSASAIRVNLEPFTGKNSHLFCRQCENPECRQSCPVNAIAKDPCSGAWKIDYDLCTKCGICVEACPFEAMFWYENDKKPLKCDLCGGAPACIEACRFSVIIPEEEEI